MKMNKQSLFLKLYAISLTFLLGYFLLSGFRSPGTEKFDEITVERINVVEPDGTLKMVISNKARQHPGMMNGKMMPQRERPAGMIFFNEEKDEVGGLVYGGNAADGAGFVLSVDQYKNDQIMQFRQIPGEDGKSAYGLQLWDRDKDFTLPKVAAAVDSLKKAGVSDTDLREKLTEINNGKPFSPERLFIGRGFDKEAGLFIQDKSGEDRLRIYVDADNQPRIEVLNAEGKVVKDLASN